MDALSQPHGFMSHHLVLKKARQLCLLVRIGLIAEIEDYHKTFSIIPLEVSSWRKVIKPDATTCTNAPSISKTVQENVPIKGKTKAASEILKVVITFLHLLHNTNPRWISFSPVEGNRCLEHISFTFNQSLALNFIGWKAYSFLLNVLGVLVGKFLTLKKKKLVWSLLTQYLWWPPSRGGEILCQCSANSILISYQKCRPCEEKKKTLFHLSLSCIYHLSSFSKK